MKASRTPLSGCFQAFLALLGGLVLFFVLLSGMAAGYSMVHHGAIYPGVSIGGIDLAGLTPEQAAARLSKDITFPETGKIVFHDGIDAWPAKPSEIGLYLDPQMSAMAAYSVGRQGNPVQRTFRQFNAWYRGIDLPPLLIYDERRANSFVESLASQINLPVVEASLEVKGVDVVAKPGQIGRSVDVAATLAPLQEKFALLTDALLPLVIYEQPPQVLDVTEQAQVARTILSQPLVLNLPDAQEGDPGPWTVEPERLAKMITIQRVEGAGYEVALNAEGLRAFLEEQAPGIARQPENARFIFNDETRQLEVIQPAVIGRALDVDGTIKLVNEQIPKGNHQVTASLTVTPPQVGDDATASSLGIHELVSSQSTYFYGSNSSRLQNIRIAASRFHGVLVPPGAVFSMAEVLGDISLDNGYAEALIIYGDRTIQGVGGGVCQVSTTLFRTVFFGGYPVTERHPHAYRVGYYEQNAGGSYNTRMAGLDATVFVPMVDFKFRNDTENWLLMETYFNEAGRSLTWKFYSTTDGRSVDWNTSGLRNITEPPDPLYQENPDLQKGEIKQVDWAVEGGDVTVQRTVMRAGQVYIEDSFSTGYIPWRAVYEYGPGTDVSKLE
jgi:vancomycin resistance protein YoaR